MVILHPSYTTYLHKLHVARVSHLVCTSYTINTTQMDYKHLWQHIVYFQIEQA